VPTATHVTRTLASALRVRGGFGSEASRSAAKSRHSLSRGSSDLLLF
jgi:hypothetical protein